MVIFPATLLLKTYPMLEEFDGIPRRVRAVWNSTNLRVACHVCKCDAVKSTHGPHTAAPHSPSTMRRTQDVKNWINACTYYYHHTTICTSDVAIFLLVCAFVRVYMLCSFVSFIANRSQWQLHARTHVVVFACCVTKLVDSWSRIPALCNKRQYGDGNINSN